MDRSARAARDLWLNYWNAMRRYHRYEVYGLEHLAACRPAMLVAYRGRPIAHDLCMLQALLVEREGRFPRAVMHRAAKKLPVIRQLVEGMAFLVGDGTAMADAVANGDHIIVTPGGTKEGCRSVRHRYRVDWGHRMGYLRVAARYGLPVIPVAAHGVDDTYVGLNDGYSWGKRVGLPGGLPLWLGAGPFGLWPTSLPFPVKITTFIGPPLRLTLDVNDRDGLAAAHDRVQAVVQRLLDLGAEATSLSRSAA